MPAAPDGFTLIELLVAVSIFVIVLAGVQSVFYTSMRLRNRVVDVVEASLADGAGHPNFAARPGQPSAARPILSWQRPAFSSNRSRPLITNPLPDQIGPDFYTSCGQMDGVVPGAT